MAQQELRILVKADGTAQVTRQLDGVNRSIQNVEASATKLSTRGEFFKGMIGGALTAVGAYFGLKTAIRTASQSLNEFLDAFSAMRELQNVLNTTGRAAEFTAQGLSDMATEIQSMTGIGNEDILRGATMGLLRFDNVGKDIFPRAQQMAIDLSKRLGGIEIAAKTLGLALSNPTLGINKMRRAGIDFTAAQREMITALADSGDLIGAQSEILRILESDYHNAAMAGVTGATMLKTAWGEYLETLGGSISAFDGVKRGLAQFFLGVAQNSQNLSQAQMQHILDVQQGWAKFTLDVATGVKLFLTSVGGAFMLVFTTITRSIDVAYAGWQEAINGFLTAWIDMSRMIIQYNPFSIIMKANQKLLELTGVKVNLDFIDQNQLALLDTLQGKIDKLFPKNAVAAVDSATQAFKQWGANVVATGDNAANTLERDTKALTEFYNAQRKMVKEGKNPFAGGAELTAADDAGALLKQIDNNQSQATERLRDMQGEMLSAWSTYYTTLDQYSNESIQAQADLYKYQLQQQYGTILSMQQIDEMYNAKLWELRDAQLAQLGNTTGDMLSAWAAYYTSLDQYSNESIEHQANLYKYQLQQQYGTILSMQQIDEMYNAKLRELRDAQLAHFAENYEEMPERAKTAYEKMQEYAANMASTIKDQAFNALENSIYSLMAETKSLKDVWGNAWAVMKDIALRAMADIITQTLRTIAIQYLLKAIMGISGIATVASRGPSVAGVVGGGIKSINTGLGSLPTGGNSNSELLMAINGLRSDLSQNQNPNFQLLLDGKELHHGLKRVASRLNYMGSGA